MLQPETIERRHRVVENVNEVTRREVKDHRLKDKGVNLKWGNTGFSEDVTDLEAQFAALESWKAAQEWLRARAIWRMRTSRAANLSIGSRMASEASKTPAKVDVARMATLVTSSDESDSEPMKKRKPHFSEKGRPSA